MLRALSIAALLLIGSGCASHRQERSDSQPAEAVLASAAIRPVASEIPEHRTVPTAAALAFDPHVPAPEVAIDLSRSARQPQAFLGYDEGVVEFFSIRTDDRQYGSLGIRSGSSGYGGYGSGATDYFEREAVSVKTGVRYH